MTQDQDDIITMFETTVAFSTKTTPFGPRRRRSLTRTGAPRPVPPKSDPRTGKQQAPTAGVTDEKSQIRDDLEEKLRVIADAVAAFAAKTGNNDLAAQVEVTKSSLDRLPDSDLIQTAQRVIDAATVNLAALGAYGVKTPDLDALGVANDLFANKKESPREAIVNRKVETLSLPEAISTVRSIIVNHAASIPKKDEPPPPPGP